MMGGVWGAGVVGGILGQGRWEDFFETEGKGSEKAGEKIKRGGNSVNILGEGAHGSTLALNRPFPFTY